MADQLLALIDKKKKPVEGPDLGRIARLQEMRDKAHRMLGAFEDQARNGYTPQWFQNHRSPDYYKAVIAKAEGEMAEERAKGRLGDPSSQPSPRPLPPPSPKGGLRPNALQPKTGINRPTASVSKPIPSLIDLNASAPATIPFRPKNGPADLVPKTATSSLGTGFVPPPRLSAGALTSAGPTATSRTNPILGAAPLSRQRGHEAAPESPAETIRKAQILKAQLTTELGRIQANPHLIGKAIPIAHVVNVGKRLKEVEATIRRAKGLPAVGSYSGKVTPQEEASLHAEDPPFYGPLADWGKATGPAVVDFMRTAAQAFSDGDSGFADSPAVRRAATSNLLPSFREGVTKPIVAAPKALLHTTSNALSADGPVDPSIYDKDVPSRISDHIGEYTAYSLPIVGPILRAAQGADVAAGLVHNPVAEAKDLYHGMAPWEAKTPEERVLRFMGLLGGAAHIAGMSPAIRGRVEIVADSLRRGKADPAVVTAILHDAHQEAFHRGNGRATTHPSSFRLERTPFSEEKARLSREKPGELSNYTKRGKPIDFGSMNDDQIRSLRKRMIERRDASIEARHGARYAENVHNLGVIDEELARRAKMAAIRPYGSFNRFNAEAQAVAASAAKNPVRADTSWKNPPLTKVVAADPSLWKAATDWFKARANEKYTVETPALGTKVGFSGAGESKGFTKDPYSQALTPYVPQLLAKAKLVMHEVGKRPARFPSVAHLVARFESPQGPRDVWMVVRRDSKGDWYYDHTHTEVRRVNRR